MVFCYVVCYFVLLSCLLLLFINHDIKMAPFNVAVSLLVDEGRIDVRYN
jgi:hypothetical protein